MRIYVLDTEDQTSNHYIALAIVAALKRHSEVEAVALGDYACAVEEFRAGDYDVFFAFGGAGAHSSLQMRLSEMSRISVLWTTEDPYELPTNIKMSQHYDIVFTNDLASVPAYRGRARHLPLAAAIDFNDFPIVDDEDAYRYDLFFVGTAWPNRVVTINKIIRHFGSALKLKVALPYNKFLERPTLVDPNLIINWRCSNFEFARLANLSRVVLSLQRRFTGSVGGIAAGSTPPPRLFETGLSGGLQVFASNSEEAKRYYKDGEEFFFCGDEDELIPMIKRALEDPARGVAIAKAARERTFKDHTYERRLERVVEAVRVATPRPPAPSERKLRTILIVTHSVLGDGGGVEIYQQQLRRMIHHSLRVLFFYPRPGSGGRVLRLIDNLRIKDFELHEPIVPGDTYHTAAENAFEEVIATEGVDLVHFQHLLGLPLSLPLIAKAYGVPTAYTYHDHYLICSQFTLLNFEDRYCHTDKRSLSQCDICLNAKEQIPVGSQARRRAFVGRLIEALDVVVASTPFSANYLKAIYGTGPDKVRVIEMMTPKLTAPKEKRRAPSFQWDSKEPLRVAVPGNFTTPKGAHYLIRAMNAMRDDNIKFTILGRMDEPFEAIIRSLVLPNVSTLGGYKQSEILEQLLEFDVSLHLAIWPETYVIALSEAWIAGLIPIVTDLGAQGERVRNGVDGFTIRANDAGAIIDVLRRVRSGAVDLEAMRAAIAKKTFAGPAEHFTQLLGLYNELMRHKPVAPLAIGERTPTPRYDLTAFACGARMNAQRWSSATKDWDESMNDVAPPPSNSGFLREFPAQYRHLRVEKARFGERVELCFERIVADGDEMIGRAPLVARVAQSLELAGWISLETKLAFVEMYLELTGQTSKALTLATSGVRPDVSQRFDNGAVCRGFHASLPIPALRNGHYTLHLHILLDGLVVFVEDAGAITIGSSVREDDAWCANPDGFLCGRPLRPLPEGAVLAVPATYVDFCSKENFDISGWTDPPEEWSASNRVALAICDADNRILAWTELEPCLRPPEANPVDQMLAFTGFKSKTPAPPPMPGAAKLAILQDLGETVGITAAMNFPIEIVATRGHRGFQFNVDKVEESSGAGKRCISVVGWMFSADRGEPMDVFLRWSDEKGETHIVAANRERRTDVRKTLDDDAAEFAGYRVLLEPALLKGRAALCQVYADAIVVFEDFTAQAKQHAESGKRASVRPATEASNNATIAPDLGEVIAALGDPGFQFRIDKIEAHGGGGGSRISVAGSMFLADQGEPRELFLRWRDGAGEVRAVAFARQSRPDVAGVANPAAQFAGYSVECDRSVLEQGKVALCQVYEAAIVSFDDFGAQALKGLETAKPTPAATDKAGAPEARAVLATPLASRKSQAPAAPLAAAPDLEEVAAALGDPGFQFRIDKIEANGEGAGSRISVAGWMFLADQGEPRELVLRWRGGAGEVRAGAFARRSRPDVAAAVANPAAQFAGYSVEIDRAVLEQGKVALCQVYDEAVVSFDGFGAQALKGLEVAKPSPAATDKAAAAAALAVLAKLPASRMSAAPAAPLAAAPDLEEVAAALGDPGFQFRIDKIEANGQGAVSRISVAGWMFLADQGEPRELFLRWRDGAGEVRAVASARQSRPDVAAAVANPAAQFAGYGVECDRAVLEQGKVVLCQVYDGVVVSFDGFGAQVLKGLEAPIPAPAMRAAALVVAGGGPDAPGLPDTAPVPGDA